MTESGAAPTQRISGELPPVAIIVNATAGSGRNAEWAERIEAEFAEHGVRARVRLANEGGDVRRFAREEAAGNARVVVAAGGDGTVNAVASELVDSETALAVLPLGTLNHFAKDLGMPLDVDGAAAAIANGHSRRVDVGEVNGRIFLNNSSIGVYPEFVRYREQAQHRLGWSKWPAALLATIKAFRNVMFLRLYLDADGARAHRDSAFAFVGNNRYRLEGFECAERDCLDAGELSLYVTHRIGRFGLLWLVLRTLAGRLHRAKDFDALTAREIRVDTAQRVLRVATDGEITLMETPLRYRIRPRALKVVAPPPDPAHTDG